MRRGFSAVELLVAMGCVSLLMALLLPAIQGARATSARTSCNSNLHQLALAVDAHVAAHGKYPDYTHTERSPTAPRPYGSLSGHVALLPFLDQSSIYRRIEPTHTTSPLAEPPGIDAAIGDPTALPVGVFSCPADSVPVGGNSYRACYGTSTGIHTTVRPGAWQGVDPFDESLWGVLNGAGKPRGVTDGHSNSVLFSERLVGDMSIVTRTPTRDVYRVVGRFVRPGEAVAGCSSLAPDAPNHSHAGTSWLLPTALHATYNHVAAPNSTIPDCIDSSDLRIIRVADGQGSVAARSAHSGGVNLVMADGATRFISNVIDLRVWRSIGSCQGHESITF
jgi:prepilin-type processing-associated H-X9-DG protein